MRKFIFFICLLSFGCGGKIGNGNSRVFKEIHEYVLNLEKYTSPVEEYIQYVPNWNFAF
ncbi:hypothetical protein MM236_18545 [Belliella sp. DSM 107340]|uniref:Lipoprotein n=1 Tax=Belliella calami TaxID=2923436 RepID=A0ABS9UUW4_9BACT|nr:hypothetical protein [Belliella calami]MCH7400000.1 hypothetical protein [Belliella calami]